MAFGKDKPENFISNALRGGNGPSNGIKTKKIDRPDQSIVTSFPMDNVKSAMPMESSIMDDGFAGGVDNLKHSLTGASAVNEEVGAAGPVKHVIIPGH